MPNYPALVRAHYENVWGVKSEFLKWTKGPSHDLPKDFCILEFAPTPSKSGWGYATCCMWDEEDAVGAEQAELLELHLWSPVKSLTCSGQGNHLELLTAVAHYHRTGAKLGMGHTVNFGRPWLPGSNCDHGLVSLPYLDGPSLEDLHMENISVRCLWLIPITQEEVDFKRENGLDALEELFEETAFNYLDSPPRYSVTRK